MATIEFCPPAPLFTSGTTLDCKMFRQSMFGFPSDRHAYFLRCCLNPMRYHIYLFLNIFFNFFFPYHSDHVIIFMFSQGRLPYQIKNFVKYIRLAISFFFYVRHVNIDYLLTSFSRDIDC